MWGGIGVCCSVCERKCSSHLSGPEVTFSPLLPEVLLSDFEGVIWHQNLESAVPDRSTCKNLCVIDALVVVFIYIWVFLFCCCCCSGLYFWREEEETMMGGYGSGEYLRGIRGRKTTKIYYMKKINENEWTYHWLLHLLHHIFLLCYVMSRNGTLLPVHIT